MSEHLLEIKNLKKTYPVYKNTSKLLRKKSVCAP